MKKIVLLTLLFCNLFLLFSCYDPCSNINTSLIKNEIEFNDYESMKDFLLNDFIFYSETTGFAKSLLKAKISKITCDEVTDVVYIVRYAYPLQDQNKSFTYNDKICFDFEQYYPVHMHCQWSFDVYAEFKYVDKIYEVTYVVRNGHLSDEFSLREIGKNKYISVKDFNVNNGILLTSDEEIITIGRSVIDVINEEDN